jgi:hypothetical protein
MWEPWGDRRADGGAFVQTADLNSNGVGAHLGRWGLWSLCKKSESPALECFILATGE